MKNKQKGFIIPLIIILLASIAIGAGGYAYHEKKIANAVITENVAMIATTTNRSDIVATTSSQHKTDLSGTTTIVTTAIPTKIILSDDQIETAGLTNYGIKKTGKDYSYIDGSGKAKLADFVISKGDLNNDNLQDAVVLVRVCGAGCFGYSSVLIVINNNGIAKSIPYTIKDRAPSNLNSEENKIDIESAVEQNGNINITSTDGTNYETKSYKLQGSVLVEI